MSTAFDLIFAEHRDPEHLFQTLLPAVGQALTVDRCFLLVRNPATRLHRVFCWRRSPNFPDVSTPGWQQEQEWEQEDPMFAAALRTDPSIFVEDIETAGADVLNVEFERTHLGHRALVHAHLCNQNQLWGILQPCVFDFPRVWTETDRHLIASVTTDLTPIVIDYVTDSLD